MRLLCAYVVYRMACEVSRKEVRFHRFASLAFRSHQPAQVMIQVARRARHDGMGVQQPLHGHVTLVDGIQMPASATKLASADANRFLMKVQVSACRLIAGVALGDDRAIFSEPFRHHWSDARHCR